MAEWLSLRTKRCYNVTQLKANLSLPCGIKISGRSLFQIVIFHSFYFLLAFAAKLQPKLSNTYHKERPEKLCLSFIRRVGSENYILCGIYFHTCMFFCFVLE